jgi:hypothetical protein
MRLKQSNTILFLCAIALFIAAGSRFVQAQTSSARYFPQTNYSVDDDQIWDYFQSRGAVNTFGYPVSELFEYEGFMVQIFQRHVLQVNGQQVRPLNLLDPDLMPISELNGSTFPSYSATVASRAPSPTTSTYGTAVAEHLEATVPNRWQGESVGFLDYYFSAAPTSGARTLLALEVWGFPTSQPQRDPNNGNFIYQRFQRGIMHYDATTDVTRAILLGDAFKEISGEGDTATGSASSAESTGSDSATSTACPAEHFLDVSTYQQRQNYPAPRLDVSCSGQYLLIESNGIPNFEFVSITPSDLREQNYSWQIPLTPQVASSPAAIPLLGPVAIAVNGIPIYGANEAGNLGYGDPMLDQILDFCNGHTARRGDYHFHARPECLFEEIEGNVSLVVAYAFDGYPVLAPYVCEDSACTKVGEVQSSWQRTQDVRDAWQAHEYIEGSGDLDQCNGMIRPDGTYAYYATDTFPYILGCYRGVANVSAPNGEAPPEGAPPQGAPPPPPPGWTPPEGCPAPPQPSPGSPPPPPPADLPAECLPPGTPPPR